MRKQVQRWLGHSSPGFTLETYIHLLDDGVGAGLDLQAELTERAAGSRDALVLSIKRPSRPRAPEIQSRHWDGVKVQRTMTERL